MPKASRRVMKAGKTPKWAGSTIQSEINRFKTAEVRRRLMLRSALVNRKEKA